MSVGNSINPSEVLGETESSTWRIRPGSGERGILAQQRMEGSMAVSVCTFCLNLTAAGEFTTAKL